MNFKKKYKLHYLYIAWNVLAYCEMNEILTKKNRHV